MQVLDSLEVGNLEGGTSLTIGSFDGVHLGHRHLLAQVVRHAAATGRLSAVLFFFPHPRLVLHPEARPAYLSTPEERISELQALGVDLLVVLPFTLALANTRAEEFVGQLVDRLGMRELWVGAGFALGRDRSGDVTHLSELGAQLGYSVHVVEPLCDNGEPVSSTRIRALVRQGDVAEAGRLLGRPYTVSGHVVSARQDEPVEGLPATSLRLNPQRAIPAEGVYAVRLHSSGERLCGVADLGMSNSYCETERLIKVHLLDDCGGLDGENVAVEFVQRLRANRVCESSEARMAQIRLDAAEARAALVPR